MDELKPCPFCGSTKLVINFNDRSPNLFPFSSHVLCLNCLASVGSHGFEQTKGEAKEKAIVAWNRRAQPESERPYCRSSTEWWAVEPDVGRVANGVPSRVDRLKCLGNAVVPQQAYPIFSAIATVIKETAPATAGTENER